MDVITMPQLGETVTEGTIIAWSVAVGDQVAVDDTLFEVSTEKVDTEIPSSATGFVRAILAAEGDTVAIGSPLVVITPTADEHFDLPNAGVPASPPVSMAARPAWEAQSGGYESEAREGVTATDSMSPGGLGREEPNDGSGPVRSPAVRRLLAEHGLRPDQIVGSGRDGRITRADVLAVAAQASAGPAVSSPATTTAPASTAPASTAPASTAPAVPTGAPVGSDDAPARPTSSQPPIAPLAPGDEVIDFGRARLATAENLVRSLSTAAHALVVSEVDYSNVDRVRRAAGLSYLPFVARAVIDAIRDFPHVNASVDDSRLVVRRAVHLGVAVDVEQEALVVPVIKDADGLRLGAIADAISDLADRARRHRLSGESLSGGTFTLTNVGAHGTILASPIINWPQVAILSTDGVRMAPTAVRTDDGTGEAEWGIAVHPVGNLSLSFDHRAFDGAYAAAFLDHVRQILQTRDWTKEVSNP